MKTRSSFSAIKGDDIESVAPIVAVGGEAYAATDDVSPTNFLMYVQSPHDTLSQRPGPAAGNSAIAAQLLAAAEMN